MNAITDMSPVKANSRIRRWKQKSRHAIKISVSLEVVSAHLRCKAVSVVPAGHEFAKYRQCRTVRCGEGPPGRKINRQTAFQLV